MEARDSIIITLELNVCNKLVRGELTLKYRAEGTEKES